MPRPIKTRGTGPPSGPLSHDEMHQLNAWLGAHGEDIHCFDELDGFITALALLPGQFSPAVWYPKILGGLDDADTERLVAEAEAAGILDLLVRHWRHVFRRLAREEKWEAAVCEDEMCHPDFYWACGLEEGICCTEDEWEHLAPMREWEQRLPSLKLLLTVTRDDGQRLVRTIEEREALLRQTEQEVMRLYREVRRAG